ncbi:hypothetical protein D9615_010328 [Tricholomella constricta]|uniref:Retrotransposon gag domain-containing protein n=1 Tax=Tricholomella constricta TaxID=117010 RepID=A0A8H5GTE7_9AGAR|nr:hypothetical protein D9615_010328 [Tricholomella constricta]
MVSRIDSSIGSYEVVDVVTIVMGNSLSRPPTLTDRPPAHAIAPPTVRDPDPRRSDPSVGVYTYTLPVVSHLSLRAPDADPDHPTSRPPASKHVSATRNPSNARPLRSPPESRLEMSEFGEFDTPSPPPALTPEERLASLETTISALSHTQTSNSATLDRISSLLDTLVLGNPSAASPAASTTPATPAQPSPTSPPPRSGSHIRPSPPPTYDGARSGGRAFWNACQLYFSLTTGQFTDDHARISWVLSFMQHGRAADFVGRVFQCGSVKRAFPTWDDFVSNFEKEFFLFDEVADAALILESTAYFQNGRTIDEYIDSFKALWVKADYPDGRHLVLKFRRGMDPKLSKRLGSITTGRPNDSKIEDWLAIARSQDFIMRTEEDFHRRTPPTIPSASRPTALVPSRQFSTGDLLRNQSLLLVCRLRRMSRMPPERRLFLPMSLWTLTDSPVALFATTSAVGANNRGTSGVTVHCASTCATSCRRNWMS